MIRLTVGLVCNGRGIRQILRERRVAATTTTTRFENQLREARCRKRSIRTEAAKKSQLQVVSFLKQPARLCVVAEIAAQCGKIVERCGHFDVAGSVHPPPHLQCLAVNSFGLM